jgi:hypothetical protein
MMVSAGPRTEHASMFGFAAKVGCISVHLQVRQLRRQVAQMTARITEQNNELILLRAEVAAHRTSSISLPDGQCSSEQPSAVTDDGGSAANRPAELRRNGGVQVIPVVTGKQQVGQFRQHNVAARGTC